MATISHPVTYQGQNFESLKEFANHLGLNYSKTVYYYKRGKTPDEIVDCCKFSTASKASLPPKESAKRFHCEYNGIQYNSLYEAACSLGFSPSQLYELRKRKNLSPSAAIAHAVETRTANGGKQSARAAKKCIVDGVEYESREAAIKAYHIPHITVYSRMEREGITFEEALSRGRHERTFIPPVISQFPALRLVPTQQIHQPTLKELATSLRYYNCIVQELQDIITQAPALLVDTNTYIYFNQEAHGIEIISELPFAADDITINMMNSSYVATKLFRSHQTGKLCLLSFQIAKEEGQDIKPLINSYFSFASTKEVLTRQFGHKEREEG